MHNKHCRHFLIPLVIILTLFTACKSTQISSSGSTVILPPSSFSSSSMPLNSVEERAPATGAPLLITPAPANERANEMEDASLIALLQNTLYKNGVTASIWALHMGGIQIDHSVTVPERNDDRHEFALVTNIQNIADLKANYSAVFSERLLSNFLFPNLFEGEYALFIEVEGRLYLNLQTGVGFDGGIAFEKAQVIAKNANSFQIQAPYTDHNIETGEMYTFTVVQNNGYWVLDNLPFYAWAT